MVSPRLVISPSVDLDATSSHIVVVWLLVNSSPSSHTHTHTPRLNLPVPRCLVVLSSAAMVEQRYLRRHSVRHRRPQPQEHMSKFREFLNGPIYWSAATGAHPVVNSFLNRWGLNGYEAGWMHYPTTGEIVLPDGVVARSSRTASSTSRFRTLSDPPYATVGVPGMAGLDDSYDQIGDHKGRPRRGRSGRSRPALAATGGAGVHRCWLRWALVAGKSIFPSISLWKVTAHCGEKSVHRIGRRSRRICHR